MSTQISIAFCVDWTSLAIPYSGQVRSKILAISSLAMQSPGAARIGLVKFRSVDDLWITRGYGFTNDYATLRQCLFGDEFGGNCLYEHAVVVKKKKDLANE